MNEMHIPEIRHMVNGTDARSETASDFRLRF